MTYVLKTMKVLLMKMNLHLMVCYICFEHLKLFRWQKLLVLLCSCHCLKGELHLMVWRLLRVRLMLV